MTSGCCSHTFPDAPTSEAQPSSAAPSPAAPPAGPPFNMSDINELFNGNSELVRMALGGFDRRAYARLQLQYEQRNFKKLGSVAHQIKGMLGYIAARQAQQTAARLEQSAKALAISDGGADFLQEEVREALRVVEAELQRVVPAVEEALDQLS